MGSRGTNSVRLPISPSLNSSNIHNSIQIAPQPLPSSSQFPLSKPRSSLVLQSTPKLALLNPLYDLTPPRNITAVVTEVGLVPPSSISSIPLAMGRQTV